MEDDASCAAATEEPSAPSYPLKLEASRFNRLVGLIDVGTAEAEKCVDKEVLHIEGDTE